MEYDANIIINLLFRLKTNDLNYDSGKTCYKNVFQSADDGIPKRPTFIHNLETAVVFGLVCIHDGL